MANVPTRAARAAIVDLRIGILRFLTWRTLTVENGQLRLRAAVTEIIKQGHAIGLCPDPDFAGILERVVIPFQSLFSVAGYGEMIAAKVHPQRVPLAGPDRHLRAFLLGAFALD